MSPCTSREWQFAKRDLQVRFVPYPFLSELLKFGKTRLQDIEVPALSRPGTLQVRDQFSPEMGAVGAESTRAQPEIAMVLFLSSSHVEQS
jgi:hypothetical protein